eukprot:2847309-Rhodomonas_salina.1
MAWFRRDGEDEAANESRADGRRKLIVVLAFVLVAAALKVAQGDGMVGYSSPVQRSVEMLQAEHGDDTPVSLTAFDPVVSAVTQSLDEKALTKAGQELSRQREIKERAAARMKQRLAASTHMNSSVKGQEKKAASESLAAWGESRETKKTEKLATAELRALETHFS